MRMAWVAWGKSRPATVVACRRRISARPWPRSRVWSATGIWRQGRILSWWSRWVCMASAVRTCPARSRPSSSGWNPVISLLLVSTWVWARTPRLVWSIAASRWTWGLGWWPLPRRVLPSTATARLGGWDVGGGGCWLASQAPIARSSASASTRASTRRTVASSGGLKAPVRSRRTPSAASTWPGASLAHSPIAASDLAPVSTAATATASTVASACRRPRRWRGSAISAR